MTAKERVAGLEFDVVASVTRAELLEAAEEAREWADAVVGRSMRLERALDGLNQYIVRGPGGVAKMALVNLQYREIDDRETIVGLSVPEFLTTQQRVAMVPVAARSAPAYRVLQRFSASLGEQLGVSPNPGFEQSDDEPDDLHAFEHDLDGAGPNLGLSLMPKPGWRKSGLEVPEIGDDSPVRGCGLEPGMRLTHLGGIELGRDSDVNRLMETYDFGDRVEMTWDDGGQKRTASVRLVI